MYGLHNLVTGFLFVVNVFDNMSALVHTECIIQKPAVLDHFDVVHKSPAQLPSGAFFP